MKSQLTSRTVPLNIYHGVPEGWRREEVIRIHRELGGTCVIDGPLATEPGAPAWLPDRHNWLQYRATLHRVADGVRKNDPACVEIGIRFIELDHIGSYSGYIRARLARALRPALLSTEQKVRLDEHFLHIVITQNFREEFSEYQKLWPGILSQGSRKILLESLVTHAQNPRSGWLRSLLFPK